MKLGIALSGERKFLATPTADGIADLSSWTAPATLIEVLADWRRWKPILDAAQSAPIVADARWTAPLPRPPKFLLLAGNFRAHVVESGFAPAPERNLTPQFFLKPSTTIIGPQDTIPCTTANHALDYEAELAVVIGARTRNATLGSALEAVWGCTIVNDISERKLNAHLVDRHKRSNDDFYDWLVGKWFDGSAPMGPFLVPWEEMEPDPIVRARLNGELVQEAPLSAMIHTVAEAIVFISAVLTLEPGDVISMGTPSGVGMARGRLLQPGDHIVCEVTGIGTLANRVVSA